MKKFLVGLLLVCVGFVALVALAVLFTEAVVRFSSITHLQAALGINTQQSKFYDTVSGVGPMMVTALGFTGLLVGVWRHVNCHQPGCLRLAHQTITDNSGMSYKVCHRHAGRSKISAEHVAKALQEHIARESHRA